MEDNNNKDSRTRLQIEATAETIASIARIKAASGLGHNAEIVRVAIKLLDDLLADVRAGASVLIVNKPGEPPERLKLLF
jgi:hypothetical protein